MERQIYLDYNSSTPIHPQVAKVMRPYLLGYFSNSKSPHKKGREIKKIIFEESAKIASFLNLEPSDIIFTSGATESNNTILKGMFFSSANKHPHFVTSQIEHPSILYCMKFLETLGAKVTYVRVGQDGVIDPDDVKKAITKDTILVSIMHVNNEIGTIQPIEKIGELAKARGILFHTDAVQSFGKLDIDFWNMPVDMISVSSHKIYGPKGVGLICMKKGVLITPLLHGRVSQSYPRAGTLNTPAIVATAKAVEISYHRKKEYHIKMKQLHDRFVSNLKGIDDIQFNGHLTKKLPNTINVSFLGVNAQTLLANLDNAGIFISAGSACESDSAKGSHVLKAMGFDRDRILSAVRFSFGFGISEDDIDYTSRKIKIFLKKLRA